MTTFIRTDESVEAGKSRVESDHFGAIHRPTADAKDFCCLIVKSATCRSCVCHRQGEKNAQNNGELHS